MSKKKDGLMQNGGYGLIVGLVVTLLFVLVLPTAVKEKDSGAFACVILLYSTFGVFPIILSIIAINNWRKRKKLGVHEVDDKKTGMQGYKVEWVWDDACKVYCKNNNKDPNNLTAEENAEIYELAGTDVAYFLAWIIRHDFLDTDDFSDEDVEDVKLKKTSAADFLCNCCDYKLSRTDFTDEIIGFVDDYFHYAGVHASGDFFKDFETFATNDLNKELFTIKFSWPDYTKFRPYIDKAYKKYQKLYCSEDSEE